LGDTLNIGSARGLDRSRSRTRVAAHALGNVLLGVAVGLLVYYGLTDLVTGVEQDSLRDDLAQYGAVASPSPDRLFGDGAEDSSLDWTNWQADDKTYWDGLAEGEVFGRLVIEAMELDTAVVKGHGREALKKGPGWVTYTDLPGPTGNCGISGHRTTYGAPFFRLDALEPGDIIDLYSPYRRYRYRVTERYQVTPDQVEVLASTESPRLTLTACDPPYSARYRLIVHADLEDVRRLPREPSRIRE